ncbi:MAG: exosortase/archaeosortase family protein [Phycisphaerales bacterium]|nr:exosortase/archaeosortase family protein [Phycisphaerales bacterium]
MTESTMTLSKETERPWTNAIVVLLISLVLLALLLWSFAPTISSLMKDWRHDDNYSVGQLVPFAALYLLWNDRKKLATCRATPCWWGIGLIVLGQLARMFGLIWMFESAERYGFVLTIAGIVLLTAGGECFWRVRWILLFLFLMVPLPGRVHNLISGPLQSFASSGAVITLELLGITVTREGNVMMLNNRIPVGVVEACSGLRMLTAFVMVAAVLAYLVNRPRWQKVTLVLSSVPVAILCNLIRLVVTAILFIWVSGELAEEFFHDFAGWVMMPLAVFILVGELWIMSRLVIEDQAEQDKVKM